MKYLKILITFLSLLCLLSIANQSRATTLKDPLTTIELDKPVHFLAPDGSDLRVGAGTYAIEPAEEWIRLIDGERHSALLIEAKKSTHEMETEHAMAMSVPGEAQDQLDHHYLILLLPGGQSLEATGSYSGIRTRGLFNKTFKKIKSRAKRAYKKTRALRSTSAEQLTKEFLKLQGQDPNHNSSTHKQLHKQAAEMRKQSKSLANKKATHAHLQKQRTKARKHLRDIKRMIETNARQAWKKARHMYRNAKKRAGSAISVTKTPSPGGPIPIPYPNIPHQKGPKRSGKVR